MTLTDYTLTDYILRAFLAALPSAAFALLFHVPVRCLGWCAAGGTLTWCLRAALMRELDLGIVTATFLSVTVMSLCFIGVSPRIRVPRPVFTVASIIPIIPGRNAYMTLLSAIQIYDSSGSRLQEIESFCLNGITTGAIMLAMGAGIALPPLFFYRKRPVV